MNTTQGGFEAVTVIFWPLLAKFVIAPDIFLQNNANFILLFILFAGNECNFENEYIYI